MIRLDRLQRWQFPSAPGRARALACFDPSRSSLLFGPAAKAFLDQPVAQLPEGSGRGVALCLLRGQAAAAVVEVHPAQALQLRRRGAVHGRGSSLLHGFGERSSQGKQQGVHPPVTMNGGINHISRMD